MLLYFLLFLQSIVIALVATLLFLARKGEERVDGVIADVKEQLEEAVAFSAKIAEVQEFCHAARNTLHELIEQAHRERDKARANALLQLRDRVNALEAHVVQRTTRILNLEKNETVRSRRKKNKTNKSASQT